nr:MFS transporter [Marinicella sp. W31]MDC2876115.1 MFS transporter [Marinicella sp. W31]
MPAETDQSFDLPGAMTATLGITLLVFTLAQAPEWGWTSAAILFSALAALILLAVFLGLEGRAASPLMPLRLLRSGGLPTAMALTFTFMATFMALPYFTTELFQRVYGYTPFQTGLAFLLPSIAIAIGTQIGGRMASRLGVRLLLLAGLATGAVGTALLGLMITPQGDYGALVPGFLILGVGQGVAWTPMWITATAGVRENEHGIASGMASTALWVGGAMGLAVLVLLADAPVGAAVSPDSLTVSIRTAIFAIAVGIALMLPIAHRAGRVKPTAPSVIDT